MQKRPGLKVIQPTLKEKKRYLVYSTSSFGSSAPSAGALQKGIEQGMLEFLGDNGYSKAGIMFIKGTGKKGIMRIDRSAVDDVRTGLMTITSIQRQPVTITCVGLSGTIANATKTYTSHGGE